MRIIKSATLNYHEKKFQSNIREQNIFLPAHNTPLDYKGRRFPTRNSITPELTETHPYLLPGNTCVRTTCGFVANCTMPRCTCLLDSPRACRYSLNWNNRRRASLYIGITVCETLIPRSTQEIGLCGETKKRKKKRQKKNDRLRSSDRVYVTFVVCSRSTWCARCNDNAAQTPFVNNVQRKSSFSI